MKNIFIDKRFL